MGKDMSSVDRPMGLQLWGECLRQTLYAVQTAPVIHVYHGDLVVHGGTSLVTRFGTMPIIIDAVVPDGTANTQKILGAVTAVFDEDMNPVKYIAATEAGDSTVAGYIMVADHPDQLFLMQEDGETNAITLSETGQNADIISVTICAGNTGTGISTQEINSDSAGATAALDVRLLYPHPDDTAEDDTNHYCRWVVVINVPFYDAFHAGA